MSRLISRKYCEICTQTGTITVLAKCTFYVSRGTQCSGYKNTLQITPLQKWSNLSLSRQQWAKVARTLFPHPKTKQDQIELEITKKIGGHQSRNTGNVGKVVNLHKLYRLGL